MPEKTKSLFPALYSLPVVDTLNLPSRAELLPKIESGELEHLDFTAQVFGTGRIRNPYLFKDEDLPGFAASFAGRPFLRNHDVSDIDARDGTILACRFNNGVFVQDIRLTTRRGMMDYLEGKIDRFSIGWFYDDCVCSICNSSYFGSTCSHLAGRRYQTANGEQTCNLIFIGPVGKETSAVNVPAVEGTGIVAALQDLEEAALQELQQLKQEVTGSQADSQAAVETVETDANLTPGQAPEAAEQGTQQAQARLAVLMRRVQIGEQNLIEGEHFMTENIRELKKQRAELIARAREIVSLADQEQRDLTDAERAEFAEILGEGENKGKVAALDEQITRIQDERARLTEAEQSLAQRSEAEKPDGSKAAMSRSAFDAMSAKERMEYVNKGGQIAE